MELLNEDRKVTAELPRRAVVWTQDNCPWCQRVKNLLAGSKYEVAERNLTGMVGELRDAFKKKYRTVPQVVIGGNVIGGFEATLRYLQRQKQAEPA